MTYLQNLNKFLIRILEKNAKTIVIGEDILDPYGGAFKVTKGLSTRFPDRVITTPISESCIVGFALGLSMRGFIPILEIMFGDFITLGYDQIVNHISKFRQMYLNRLETPIIIRTPMGGGRGYGPTHSQSLEKHLLGIPDLRIVAPSHFHKPGEILENMVDNYSIPFIFIEHKLLYPKELITNDDTDLFIEYIFPDNCFPIAMIKNYHKDKAPDIILISYGGTSVIIEEVMRLLKKEEIYILAILPSDISEPFIEYVYDFIKTCGKVIIIEEGVGRFGWSAEIYSEIYKIFPEYNNIRIKRIFSMYSIIPAAKHLEYQVLPNKEKIIKSIEELLT